MPEVKIKKDLFLNKLTNKRWKRVVIFTMGWCVIVIGGGLIYYSEPRYNLELSYWYAFGVRTYILIALPLYLLFDVVITRMVGATKRGLYFSLLIIVMLSSYWFWMKTSVLLSKFFSWEHKLWLQF